MNAKDKSPHPEEKNALTESYNKFKEFEGRRYTGMKVGRSHSWIYDQGAWKETKITPDEWEIHYAVTKRRKGKAPEGSGVPVGTKYHWYILAHQIVEKLNANDYSTELAGLKFKVAHQRADKDAWNISDKAQKKRLIKILKEVTHALESELEIAAETRKARKRKPKVTSSAKVKTFDGKIAAQQDASFHGHKKEKKKAAHH
ncbi:MULTISPECIES: hypothetical protein [Legionella]|uniref:hypothetical protein n=1 Tax=Legionella TaxID=445 RepID=UPI0018F4DA50|nr:MULTISPECIES: hypothetical protein [Legionella]MCP0913421.1 hypothetical protein [Legionella sp. 27cVA30]